MGQIAKSLTGPRRIYIRSSCVNVCIRRQTTEALLRYHLYVDCMPVEGMEGMSEEELTRVTNRASHNAKNDRYIHTSINNDNTIISLAML